MGMPQFPDVKPKIDLKIEEVIKLLLSSIALEEMSMAHLMNAEGEKLQEMVAKACSFEELLEANDSVDKVLRTIIKKEMLLEFKFENILELLKKYKKDC